MSVLNALPPLSEFRVEVGGRSIAHLIFDMPGRSMNVFSNAAIHELGRFAAWLRMADVRGVVIRSGKASGFCVGADLAELGAAYDMIMAAPPSERFRIAFDHFFPLSQAIRALESTGKPVAAAIAGLALGGGCELALGAHYRVLVDDPKAALGLPESLVGLLPGGGGTQRLPRLVGLDASLPILLEGERLAGEDALSAGLVDELVVDGEEVQAAVRWIEARENAKQPRDRPDWQPPSPAEIGGRIDAARTKVLAETLGHYPAPLAILDCLEQGLPQPLDKALRTEMSIFSHLIQRPEPRNVIRTLFLGRLDYERAARAGSDPVVEAAVRDLLSIKPANADVVEALAAAGIGASTTRAPVQTVPESSYWIDALGPDPRKELVKQHIATLAKVASRHDLDEKQQRAVDYRVVTEGAYAAYLPSLFSLVGT